MISDTNSNWNEEVGEILDSEKVATMHQICVCTKQLSFSKNLFPLLDENDIYINQMFISKTFSRIDLKKMTSNLSDDIDILKSNWRYQTWRYMHSWNFLFYIYCFNKRLSINDSTQKNQKILLLKLSSHLSLKQTRLNSNRRLIYRHSDSKPHCQQWQ